MTTRLELEELLRLYQNQVGRGKMDSASKTLTRIILLLADAILPAAPAEAKPIRTSFEIEVGGLPAEKAKEILAEQLGKVTEAHAAAVDTHSGGNPAVLRDMPSEPPAAAGEVCAPCDVSDPNNPALIDEFKTTVVDEEAGTVTRNGITEPIIEHAEQGTPASADPDAPAPKTLKKPKAST